MELLQKINKLNEALGMKLFSSINCFDYSKFCSKNLSIYDFPSFIIFKYGRLINKFKYLPEDEKIFNHIKLFVK